jgi:hypothetical protein
MNGELGASAFAGPAPAAFEELLPNPPTAPPLLPVDLVEAERLVDLEPDDP